MLSHFFHLPISLLCTELREYASTIQLVPFLMVISQEISACQSTETCYITQIFFQILFEPDTTLNIVIFDSQPQILNGIRVKFKFGSL